MIREINVHDHKTRMGESDSQHRQWKQQIYNTIQSVLGSIDLRRIDVYNMGGSETSVTAGNEDRAIVLFHTRHVRVGEGIEIVLEDEGVVGEYLKSFNTLVIFDDVLGRYDATNINLVHNILLKWKQVHWDRLQLEKSWIHTSNKNSLTATVSTRLKQELNRQIAQDRQNAERFARNIDEYKRSIKQAYDNLIRLRNNIETQEANASNISEKVIKELDLIVQNPKISDIHIDGNKFTLFVPNVYTYDLAGNRYYTGNFRVEINIDESDVRFFGDNPRRGFWNNDPHPHVNGDDGYPCLGSVASTIAELCSRYELYALALVCVDFLESANEDDPAGRKIHLWDKVDEEGNVIELGSDEDEDEGSEQCYECEDHFHEGDMYTCYGDTERDSDGDVIPIDDRRVCDGCRSELYHFSEEADEYIRD